MMETASDVRNCIIATQTGRFADTPDEFVSGWDAAMEYLKNCIDGNYPPTVLHAPKAA